MTFWTLNEVRPPKRPPPRAPMVNASRDMRPSMKCGRRNGRHACACVRMRGGASPLNEVRPPKRPPPTAYGPMTAHIGNPLNEVRPPKRPPPAAARTGGSGCSAPQ